MSFFEIANVSARKEIAVDILVLRESDGKIRLFGGIGRLRHLEKQTGSKKDQQNTPIIRIQWLPIITGTVTLVDITEQSRGLPLQCYKLFLWTAFCLKLTKVFLHHNFSHSRTIFLKLTWTILHVKPAVTFTSSFWSTDSLSTAVLGSIALNYLNRAFKLQKYFVDWIIQRKFTWAVSCIETIVTYAISIISATSMTITCGGSIAWNFW